MLKISCGFWQHRSRDLKINCLFFQVWSTKHSINSVVQISLTALTALVNWLQLFAQGNIFLLFIIQFLKNIPKQEIKITPLQYLNNFQHSDIFFWKINLITIHSHKQNFFWAFLSEPHGRKWKRTRNRRRKETQERGILFWKTWESFVFTSYFHPL